MPGPEFWEPKGSRKVVFNPKVRARVCPAARGCCRRASAHAPAPPFLYALVFAAPPPWTPGLGLDILGPGEVVFGAAPLPRGRGDRGLRAPGPRGCACRPRAREAQGGTHQEGARDEQERAAPPGRDGARFPAAAQV